LLKESLNCVQVDPLSIKDLIDNPPEDAKYKIYYTLIGRSDYLKKTGQPELAFNGSDYDKDPESYTSIFHTKFLPNFSVFVNCLAWKKGT
jgi:hypothetical protein